MLALAVLAWAAEVEVAVDSELEVDVKAYQLLEATLAGTVFVSFRVRIGPIPSQRW